MKIPFLDRAQSREVDRLMVEKYGVSVERMMELAGWQIAKFVSGFQFSVSRILVVCGKGNNGGDGLCAARHLYNRGYGVKVFVSEPLQLKEEPQRQLQILEKIEVTYFSGLNELEQEILRADLIVDALLGYNLKGDPRSPYDAIIPLINTATCPVVAVDVPSGWNCGKGKAMEPCIRASDVLCLSFPKKGLERYRGRVYVADIGVPQKIWKELGLSFINWFAKEDIVPVK